MNILNSKPSVFMYSEFLNWVEAEEILHMFYFDIKHMDHISCPFGREVNKFSKKTQQNIKI